jgi:cobalt/nickel transport system permease protein
MAVGLKKIDYQRLPVVAILSAVFFVASLIHIPLGPASVHLLMIGLVGLILGWGAFPAIFMGLALQALLFQFGGLLVLGVNTFDMALPALLAYLAFMPLVRKDNKTLVLVGGFLAGSLSVLLSSLLTALSLFLSGDAFRQAAQALVLAHVPVMVIEGVVTALAAVFLKQVRPAMLAPDS